MVLACCGLCRNSYAYFFVRGTGKHNQPISQAIRTTNRGGEPTLKEFYEWCNIENTVNNTGDTFFLEYRSPQCMVAEEVMLTFGAGF